MYERFTDTARQAMVCANGEAERSERDYVGSLHIIVGVLDSAASVREILGRAAVDVEALRTSASELSKAPSAGTQQAIEEAIHQAGKYNSGAVDAQHLLLGVLTAPDESVATLFEAIDTNIDDVRRALETYLEDENTA